MTELYHIVTIIVLMSGMLLAFKMGYKAAGREEKLIFDTPKDLKIIETEAVEEAPKSEEEIRRDMENARKLMEGYEFES